MPADIRMIRASDFIRLSADRKFDFAASKVALVKLARALRERGINEALVDLRALESPGPHFSPSELALLIRTFHEMGFTKEHRIALLYTVDPRRHAELFAVLGRLRGWQLSIFDNHDEALSWLAADTDGENGVQTMPVPINVKKRHARAKTKGQTGSRPKKRHLISRHSAA